MGLTNKRHQQFIEHYMINGMNGTQAYLSTYPKASARTAQENSFKLLNNTDIKLEVERLQAETSQKIQVTKEMLINDLLKIKDLCISDQKYINNSIKAIDTINKMLGFNAAEKQEVTLSGPIDISKLIGFDEEEKQQLND